MVSRVSSRPGRRRRKSRKPRLALACLALGSTSCVPLAAIDAPLEFAAPVAAAPEAWTAADLPAMPLSEPPVEFADMSDWGGYVFRGNSSLDELRALDCLAQAIYYEAASESEDGQRAVAQVVLNRVRHPAWPNSVCGVVYQGPMRAGGGCQFTFTCDGALAARPGGIAWARARTLAAEALAGRVYEPIGQSTHYHTHAVSPAWAPQLHKTMVIGAHNFYRLPGAWGEPRAFANAYAGSEPMPRPAMTMLRRPAVAAAGAPPVRGSAAPRYVPPPSDIPRDPRWEATDLPASTIRPEYRHSGEWRSDAPAGITGR